LFFLEPPSSLVGPGDAIHLPPASAQIEHEAEIGVIIGARLTHADEREARLGIQAITCLNDVTARDLQRTDGQWTRAKGFDPFCPVGPRSVVLDPEFDLTGLEISCRVNGRLRQHAFAREMSFSIPRLVSALSAIMTLEPGDLLATGTPAGVGPLLAGDVVTVEIPEVGVLSNPVVAASVADDSR